MMNNTPYLVDISSLVADLDRLIDFNGSDSDRFERMLDLVERLRGVASEGHASAPADLDWAAVAFGGGADLDLYCSRLDAVNVVVRGAWAAGRLVSAWHSAGDRMWLVQTGADNELLRSVHTGPTAAEVDLIAPGLSEDLERLTSGMIDELKGKVDGETRALIEAAMTAPPGRSPNGKNGTT